MRFLRLTALGATLALALTTVGTANAVGPTPAEILQAGAQQGVDRGYPGVVGMVRRGTDAQYVHAGVGERGKNVAADPKAKFRIGSNTKAFVSTVLLQLEGERKLSLDDTVAKWLPNAVNANGYDGKKISIRQLLNHTSGLPDYFVDPRVLDPYVDNTNPRQPWPPQKLVDIALSHRPDPNTGIGKFAYSNTNYILAGMVIKAITGSDAAVEVQRRIIEPLGLRDTTLPTAAPELSGAYLHGYYYSLSNYRDVSVSNVQTTGTAGAIVSTLDDLAMFERALFTGRLLPQAQLAELKTTVPSTEGNRYGLGVIDRDTRMCGRAWSHAGALLGYYSVWLSSEDGSKQVVITANEFHMAPSTQGQTGLLNAAFKAYCAL